MVQRIRQSLGLKLETPNMRACEVRKVRPRKALQLLRLLAF